MNRFFVARKTPFVIAHRGASSDAPENTISAFSEALRQGADAIELDVQQSKDKKLVLMHDYSLRRTTGVRGKVSSLTLRQLKQLDVGNWFGPKYRGERIPTLEEVLDTYGAKTNYVIELKFYRMKTGRFARRVYDAVASRKLLDHVLFLSFDPRLLMQIEKNNPAAKTCWAFVPILGWRPPHWLVSRFDVLAIASKKADPKYTDKLASLGKPVDIWASSSQDEQYDDEMKSGAQFITTNHPAKLRELLSKQD